MKKIFCVLLLFFMSLTLTSCGHIEDVNGPDDYSVKTIYDPDILSPFRSCVSFGSSKTRTEKNGVITGSFKSEKMSGVLRLENFKWSNEKTGFNINFKVESGNAMVAVSSYGVIVEKIEANKTAAFSVEANQKFCCLYLVGESAKVALEYTIEAL